MKPRHPRDTAKRYPLDLYLRGAFLSAIVLSLGFIACKQPHPAAYPLVSPTASSSSDSTETFSAATFHPSPIRYARGFSIETHDHYKLVRVLNRMTTTTDTLFYLLVPQGQPAPAGYPGAQVIHTPVRSIVGMSSMHIALADFAGAADLITGLGSFDYVSLPLIRDKIKTGKIRQVGLDGNMNNELIITMHPDVLIAMGNPDAGFGRYKTLTDAGIPVLLNTEWLESTPLGRAEWVKLMGALTGKEEEVDKKFDSVASQYNVLAKLGSAAQSRPRVIIGLPFKGSWFVPSGGSYMGQFLRDAGAGYKWGDSKGTGSLALNFESVASEALTADYWLNVGYVDSKNDITAKDLRYGAFRSFRTDKVYNNNLRTNDIGANDYWESGALNPQIVLADMIRILHPDLLPDHQLVYYKQLK
jgi:iron complex transport system substrate-binding protein